MIYDAVRNSLWNVLKLHYWDELVKARHSARSSLSDSRNSGMEELCEKMWLEFFKEPLDTLSDDWDSVLKQLRANFFKYEWYEVYDFVEFMAQSNSVEYNEIRGAVRSACNTVLEREVSAYRFVDSEIAPITDEVEIESIEQAIEDSKELVSQHLKKALGL
ncbi:MAG: hypothetical protein VCD00_10040 [Candidatus Hydrogenedentota bacterium]